MAPSRYEALLDAVERGDAAWIAAALDGGTNPNGWVVRTARVFTGESVESYGLETVTRCEWALEAAVRCGHRDIVELLVARGAIANTAALWHAVQGNDPEMVRRLLNAGASPNGLVWTTEDVVIHQYPDTDYLPVHLRVPLMTLASQGRSSASFVLLAAAGGRATGEQYRSVLLGACRRKDLDALCAVLDVAECRGVPLGPIELVEQDLAILRFVLERRWRLHPESATPESRRAELTPCLMKAASAYGAHRAKLGLRETATWLIAQGADPDFFDPRPQRERDVSPLHEALRSPDTPEMIKLLLDHGARTTFVFEDGHQETALEVAKRSLHPDAVSWMAEVLRPYERARAEGRR